MQHLPSGIDEAADILYGQPPSEFVAIREELAAALRAAGRTALARDVKRLRRPTVSAWALNLIARREPQRLSELLALGAAIGNAQRLGRLDELRTLGQARSEHVAALVAAARTALEDAGHQMSSEIALDIETTLAGALADENTAELVRAGRLERPVQYAGLGPAPAPRLGPSVPAKAREEVMPAPEAVRPAEPEPPDLDELGKEYEAARARHAQALANADRIDDERVELRSDYDKLRKRLKDLEAKLRAADRAASEALREVGRADRDMQRVRQALEKVREAHARARQRGG